MRKPFGMGERKKPKNLVACKTVRRKSEGR